MKSKEQVYVSLETATTTPDYRNELIDNIIHHLEKTTSLLNMFKQYM